MRIVAPPALMLAVVLTLASLTLNNQVATAQDKSAAASRAVPTKPMAKPAGLTPEMRARAVSKLPGASPNDVSATPIPGIYEVTMGGLIAYVSEDGKYMFSGNVYDLDSQVNLTAARRNNARARVLAAAKEDQMIIFSPANPKMTVTVFTDVDCGFCRKFHGQIADYNKAGVRVRYMFYPRTGPGTDSWARAEQVWCASDRREALTKAKRGENVTVKGCKSGPVIKSQYDMGEGLGVEGTPAIFTQNGDYIGGYMSPTDLVAAIQKSQASAGVAGSLK